jgi:hypothetical protein
MSWFSRERMAETFWATVTALLFEVRVGPLYRAIAIDDNDSFRLRAEDRFQPVLFIFKLTRAFLNSPGKRLVGAT